MVFCVLVCCVGDECVISCRRTVVLCLCGGWERYNIVWGVGLVCGGRTFWCLYLVFCKGYFVCGCQSL